MPELEKLEQTKKPVLRRGVTVMVLVPGMSNSMNVFKEEQAEQSALGGGVAVTDFIEESEHNSSRCWRRVREFVTSVSQGSI